MSACVLSRTSRNRLNSRDSYKRKLQSESMDSISGRNHFGRFTSIYGELSGSGKYSGKAKKVRHIPTEFVYTELELRRISTIETVMLCGDWNHWEPISLLRENGKGSDNENLKLYKFWCLVLVLII